MFVIAVFSCCYNIFTYLGSGFRAISPTEPALRFHILPYIVQTMAKHIHAKAIVGSTLLNFSISIYICISL